MKSDEDIDQLLRSHLAGELDPQRGRALAAFEQSLAREHVTRRRWWIGGIVGSLVAASIAAIVLMRPETRLSAPLAPLAPPENPVIAQAPAPSDEPQGVERLVTWQMIDDGSAVLGNELPVRRIRQEAVQQVRWFDPQRKATIRVIVPEERVFLVEQQ